jgi:thiol-disulfide isomerase/thioredoxin
VTDSPQQEPHAASTLGSGAPPVAPAAVSPSSPSLVPGLGLFLQIVFVALSALGVYLFIHAARDGETRRLCAPLCSIAPDYAANNRRAPEFELPALNGAKVNLKDYRGKVVVLNFWTKTCKPCLEEMPSLNEFGRVLRNQEGVVLLTVNTDESPEDARNTLLSVLGEDVAFQTLNDPESNVVRGKFGTSLFPETWIIDGDGIIRARLDGPRDWLSLAPLMLQLVETIRAPITCGVEFSGRRPSGSTCSDIPSAS